MNMNGPKTKNQPGKPPLGDAVGGAPRILVADDDPLIIQTVSSLLKRAGYKVTTASDGLEAWEALNDQSFDLIVTDEEMPGLTGHELILRARQHALRFPIVVMSAQLDFFLDPKSKNLHVARLLQKPFDLSGLTDAVAHALHCAPETAAQADSECSQIPKASTD